jgi:hypothetical protein
MKALPNPTKILLLSVCTLLLASCSKYQVGVLSSSNIKKDQETGKFIAENDSVKITYSFWGRNAPINLNVYNKLNVPMYVDWQRSSFIVDDRAVSYADNRVVINSDISTTTVGGRSASYSSGTIDAVASLPRNVVFVPPHAQVSKQLLEVSGQFFDLPDSVFTKKEITTSAAEGNTTVKIGEFTKANSPLSFRSYLTLYTLENNVPQFTAYEHDFFVSKIIKLSGEPAYYDMYQSRGDYYYTQKSTTGGKIGTGIGLAGLVIGAAALSNATQTAK